VEELKLLTHNLIGYVYMDVVMDSLQLVTFVNSVVIPICLFLIMMGMGLTLVVNDFKRVVKFPKAVSIGLANQLIMLPLIGFALANIMPLRPEYAVGVMLLVLCPGWTTSNLFTFLAKGDVALSVTMTAIASVITVFIDAKETFGRSLGSLFTSAFTAGLEIGISFFVILSAFTLIGDFMPNKYAMVLASLLYPIGFIIVVIGQSLLFTEQTSLLSLPVLNKIEPLHKLLRLWGIVIAGNVVGGCLFAALMIGLGLNMGLFTVANIDAYAEHVLGFKWWVIFGSAVLAGWMMGIAAWLVTSARDTLSRIVLVTLITGSIGFLGLHHSIVGNIEVFAALMYGSYVTLTNYMLFLFVVLAGNTVGGVVFVAVLKNRTFLFDVAKVREESAEDKSNKLARLNGRER